MPDYSGDSEDELGAYIYSTSHTAKLFREKAAARNNEKLSTNNDNDSNIRARRSKRKSPHEVGNALIPSEPKECTKKKRKKYIYTCSNEGCANQVRAGGVCIRHGAKVKVCSTDGCNNNIKQGGVCLRHGAKVKLCSHEGCTNYAKKKGVCWSHGANKMS